MNHKNLTLALAVVVTAVAITAIASAVPQAVMAGGHHSHHNGGSIKVNQAANQFNECGDSTCLNDANNTASIHK